MSEQDNLDREFFEYLKRIADTVFWENRKNYYYLLEQFLTKQIDVNEFVPKFFEISTVDIRRSNTIRNDFNKPFEICDQAFGFEALICEIASASEAFNSTPIYDYEIDEDGLRIFVQNIFPKIQKYLERNSLTFLFVWFKRENLLKKSST